MTLVKLQSGEMYCGVLPESADILNHTGLHFAASTCMLDMKFGARWPGGTAWTGMQSFKEADCLTLELNPVKGTLAVRLNGQDVGVLDGACTIGRSRFAVLLAVPGDCVRISSPGGPDSGGGTESHDVADETLAVETLAAGLDSDPLVSDDV